MPVSATGGLSRRATLYAAFASVAGWAFDLFDLFILLYIAGTVGELIFPAHSPTLSLAAVYASFAVSVLLRPAGAAIFGAVADRSGRKKTMVIVLAGVGLSTAAMGVVPTYATAGLVAPLLFLALRLVQGIFVGGVVAATHTLGTESVPPRWRGMMSGLVGGGGAGLGAALASGLYILVSQLFPGEQFDAWGWRVMFFAGLVAALLSYLVVRGVEESPLWRAMRETGPPAKVRISDLVRGGRGRMFALNILLVAGAGSQYYLTSGFLPTLLGEVNGVHSTAQGVMLLVSNLGVVVAAVLAGHLSEFLGRRRTMLAIGGVNLAALPLLIWLITSTDPASTASMLGYVALLAFLANAAYAPVMVFLNERYPTALRSRGTAVCWNIGFMIGGLMPTFVNLASPGLADVPGRLMIFLAAVVLVFLVANVVSPETRGNMESEADLSTVNVKEAR
ncbi:MFS transporter [Prauserella muralis]|uniref:MFS transporter n=1 Tax=Prauserella muralis TaxID=588067 RepID=A0A2V4ATK1_9PSEU|nr:MFS transporter [Prauserella muralis]PXY22871.1 MFS transporter [Prauserella muralis]TWE28632.1 putative MFS family arabinose efflux permease [Prauserella muralis]